MIFERLQPSKLQEASDLVQLEADAGQNPGARPETSCMTAFGLGQPNWQPTSDLSASCRRLVITSAQLIPCYFQ
jgi:hypothetical protein